MKIIDIHEAKARLSQLLATGEQFVIAKAGKPTAKVTAIDSPNVNRQKRLGFMKDEFKVPEDFDRMDQDEITAIFRGQGESVFNAR